MAPLLLRRRLGTHTCHQHAARAVDLHSGPKVRPLDASTTQKLEASRYQRKQEAGTARDAPAASRPALQQSSARPPRSSPAPHPSLAFARMYGRGDLPCLVDQSRPGKNGIRWRAALSELDMHLYLPLFVDGLVETQEPYRTLAQLGTRELLAGGGDRVLPVIPQLVMPLRAALRAGTPHTVAAGLCALQLLAGCCEQAGRALLPYYRQLLPPLHRHLHENVNIGDAIHYGQREQRGSLGDLVQQTLQLLERRGGPSALTNIKHMLPVYQSCLQPA